MLSAFCLIVLFSLADDGARVTKPLALTHVTVIDVTGAPPKQDQTILIEDGRISRVGPAKRMKVPKNVQLVDAGGLYLIPGLWDMHVHVWDAQFAFPLFLANGVTGVRTWAV